MFVTSFGMLFMNNTNNVGPTTEPCGMPLFTAPQFDSTLQYKPFVFCYGEMILASLTDFLLFQTPQLDCQSFDTIPVS